jgi:hypothetical protein
MDSLIHYSMTQQAARNQTRRKYSTTGVLATSDANAPSVRGLQDELRSGIGVVWPAAGISVPDSGVIQGIFEYSNVTFIGAGSLNDAI